MCSESFRTHPVFNVMLIRFEFSCIHWCNFFCSFDELNTSEYKFYDFTKVPHWKMKSNQNICISVIISMSKIDLMTCAINVSATSVRIIHGIKKKNTHTHIYTFHYYFGYYGWVSKFTAMTYFSLIAMLVSIEMRNVFAMIGKIAITQFSTDWTETKKKSTKWKTKFT